MRIPFYFIALSIIAAIFLPAWYLGLIGTLTIESLIGAFLGTVAGAILVYHFQLRMEQTRFFQLVLAEINTIFPSLTAWKKVEGIWKVCEFSEAVGLAKWTTNFEEVKSSKLPLHEKRIDRAQIDWKGVVYLIDDNFCVASKPLHEYSNWYGLLLNGLENSLLTETHIKMLWRSLVDNFFEKAAIDGAREGMKHWSEAFIFGGTSEVEKHPGIKSHREIMRILKNYEPVIKHCDDRNGSI